MGVGRPSGCAWAARAGPRAAVFPGAENYLAGAVLPAVNPQILVIDLRNDRSVTLQATSGHAKDGKRDFRPGIGPRSRPD